MTEAVTVSHNQRRPADDAAARLVQRFPCAGVFGGTTQPVSHWPAGSMRPVALAEALQQISDARGTCGLLTLPLQRSSHGAVVS